jgi:hypothetical protein
MAIALAIVGIAGATNFLFRMPDPRKHDRMYVEATEWMRRLPPDVLVVCELFSGMVYFRTDFPILRWDTVTAVTGPRYATALKQTGRPVFAVMTPAEFADSGRSRIGGVWTKVADFDGAAAWKVTFNDARDAQAPSLTERLGPRRVAIVQNH